MTKKNTEKKTGGHGERMAIGAGLAALGAGAYYLLGPNAKEHQKKASSLMAKMKKEVGVEIKKAKNASAPMYHKAVDIISANYIKQYKDHEGEIKALTKKLKSELNDVEKLADKTAKKAAKNLKTKKA